MMDDDRHDPSPAQPRLAELSNAKLELEIRKLDRQIRLREVARSALVALAICIAVAVAAVLVVTRLI